MDDLNPRQQKFVLEYLKCGEGRKAAIAAGYSASNAEFQASRLLALPKIKAHVTKKHAKLMDKLEVSVERVLKERARMAFYDIGEVVDHMVKEPKDIAKLPEDLRQAITGWKYDRQGRFVLQLSDKNPHLTAIEKHLGMYDDSEKSSPLNIHIHL